ncbi:hypothetical protein E2562_018831 [Oryza meyeriana var. granulata]|uniref:Uncharacterized protein n=1 Tax=Oryza meyeriana var. granulata TaxID=110450 RepID=A0A6G1F9J5_9ORYZ|nr:hypothetical protein E2562_018831 [Oryza meyeriana var. granulata]
MLLALAYAAAMLVVFLGGGRAGLVGVVAGALRRRAPAPTGSVYRSHLVFERLLSEMRASASRPHPLMASHNKKSGKRWAPCISKRMTQSGYNLLDITVALGEE